MHNRQENRQGLALEKEIATAVMQYQTMLTRWQDFDRSIVNSLETLMMPFTIAERRLVNTLIYINEMIAQTKVIEAILLKLKDPTKINELETIKNKLYEKSMLYFIELFRDPLNNINIDDFICSLIKKYLLVPLKDLKFTRYIVSQLPHITLENMKYNAKHYKIASACWGALTNKQNENNYNFYLIFSKMGDKNATAGVASSKCFEHDYCHKNYKEAFDLLKPIMFYYGYYHDFKYNLNTLTIIMAQTEDIATAEKAIDFAIEITSKEKISDRNQLIILEKSDELIKSINKQIAAQPDLDKKNGLIEKKNVLVKNIVDKFLFQAERIGYSIMMNYQFIANRDFEVFISALIAFNNDNIKSHLSKESNENPQSQAKLSKILLTIDYAANLFKNQGKYKSASYMYDQLTQWGKFEAFYPYAKLQKGFKKDPYAIRRAINAYRSAYFHVDGFFRRKDILHSLRKIAKTAVKELTKKHSRYQSTILENGSNAAQALTWIYAEKAKKEIAKKEKGKVKIIHQYTEQAIKYLSQSMTVLPAGSSYSNLYIFIEMVEFLGSTGFKYAKDATQTQERTQLFLRFTHYLLTFDNFKVYTFSGPADCALTHLRMAQLLVDRLYLLPKAEQAQSKKAILQKIKFHTDVALKQAEALNDDQKEQILSKVDNILEAADPLHHQAPEGFVKAKKDITQLSRESSKNLKSSLFNRVVRDSKLDDATAMYNRALSYQMGHGTPVNLLKAVEWYKKCYPDSTEEQFNNAYLNVKKIAELEIKEMKGEKGDDFAVSQAKELLDQMEKFNLKRIDANNLIKQWRELDLPQFIKRIEFYDSKMGIHAISSILNQLYDMNLKKLDPLTQAKREQCLDHLKEKIKFGTPKERQQCQMILDRERIREATSNVFMRNQAMLKQYATQDNLFAMHYLARTKSKNNLAGIVLCLKILILTKNLTTAEKQWMIPKDQLDKMHKQARLYLTSVDNREYSELVQWGLELIDNLHKALPHYPERLDPWIVSNMNKAALQQVYIKGVDQLYPAPELKPTLTIETNRSRKSI